MAKNNWLKEEIDNFFEAFKKITRGEFPVKETKITSEQQKQNQALVDRLKELEAKYKEREEIPQPDYEILFPPTLGLVPKEVPQITDEDIEKRAEEALLPDYTKKVNKLELDTFADLSEMQDKLTSANIKYDEDMANLESGFKALIESQKNDLIRKGIIHSSISANTLADTGEEMEQATREREIKYEATLEKYNKAIELIEQNRVYALREYELKYAADLEGKIISLKKERDNLIAAINTYNAKVIKDEAAYQKYREDSIRKMEKDRHAAQEQRDKETAQREKVTGYTGVKAAEMDARYRYALEFYNSVPKDVAIELIRQNEDTLKSALGFRYADLAAAQLARST
ncbi:MAG: hypothetical protein ACOYIQ_02525 [Christensenellales bacterium]|jgi:hypothetical protein